MFTDMKLWTKIRLEVSRGKTSKREILQREGIHWETLKKMLENSEPPDYRREQPRPKPKIGPLSQFGSFIGSILSDNEYPDWSFISFCLFFASAFPLVFACFFSVLLVCLYLFFLCLPF